MRICFLDVPSLNIRNGNVVTSERWRALFASLGHCVIAGLPADDGGCDLLVVFNAYKNRQRIYEARQRRDVGRILVCLTGTDLYEDMQREPAAMDVFDLVDQVVVLQPEALAELPAHVRAKAMVVFQSATAPSVRQEPVADAFEVCVIAHLRPVKDPLRAALAARLLPPESRLRVFLIGKALTGDLADQATREMAENRRFAWLGERSGRETAQLLAKSRLLVVSSLSEGGANVVSEAVVSGIPVLGTDIPCLRGLLGTGYPGLFPVGDTERLAQLLWRAETDHQFYAELQSLCAGQAEKFAPAHELQQLQLLLARIFPETADEILDACRAVRQ